MEYIISTQQTPDGNIMQDLSFEANGIRESIIRQVIAAQDAGIRQALIEQGWVPPSQFSDSAFGNMKLFDDATSDALAAGRVEGRWMGQMMSEEDHRIYTTLRNIVDEKRAAFYKNNAELIRDAERYRWMRSHTADLPADIIYLAEGNFDRRIDAAKNKL